ncbi:MAG: hypothetical protein MK240_05145 [Opitutales bacterium]|nr:hypothetical protein [Opitutales bacterium]
MLGVTVFPEYIQSEGIEPLLDNLLNRAPVSAVSISPYVMSLCPKGEGGKREPPADAEKGLTRLLERPLWGKKEVWVKASPSFTPNESFYDGLRYQPSKATDETRDLGPIIAEFIPAAQSLGLKVYFQIQSAIPPGYRVQFGGPIEDDKPLLPNGKEPDQTLDNNGSLASPHILDYGTALTADLLQNYPDIDGIRIDWPEIPPYFLETVFTDFGPHVEQFARNNGFDFEDIRNLANDTHQRFFGSLTDKDLEAFIETPELLISDLRISEERAKLKTSIVANLLQHFRDAMDAAGGKEKALIPSAFPSPWNQLSGFDYATGGEIASAISCKYYTMHWPMMLRNYSDTLTRHNPNLSRKLLADCLCGAFEAVSPTPDSSDAFEYPALQDNHPVSHTALSEKQKLVESECASTPVWPLTHAFGPIDDVVTRARAVFSVSKKRLWINRYAYLTDEKLSALGAMMKREY